MIVIEASTPRPVQHRPWSPLHSLGFTCSLHCSSFLGVPYRILIMYLVKPKKGTTMETIGRVTFTVPYRIVAGVQGIKVL